MDSKPACKSLVLDAGPLLALSPLRGLAETFYTVPQVLDELKDKRAREHFQKLGLSAGVRIQVQSPDAQSMAHVIQFAKKTGDYSVLSTPDLAVLALTYMLEQKAKAEAEASSSPQQQDNVPAAAEASTDLKSAESQVVNEPQTAGEASTSEETLEENAEAEDAPSEQPEQPSEEDHEPLDVKLERLTLEETGESSKQEVAAPPVPPTADDGPLYDDPSDEDDGEGEWITPSNVGLHKSRALHLVPDEAGKGKRKPAEQIKVGCMTADFAMQNVLLQMNLSLVGVEGKKIERVKSWVLRCHACFKICKDSSRKFCPSCGNPTLLRASVTLSSPSATDATPTLQVHLKANFQFKTRGTKYAIPAPRAGSAKTGPGEGLILREDQTAWLRAKKHADGRREREEKRMLSGTANAREPGGVAVGSWMDPDWVPEMLSVGAGGKGRSMRSGRMDGDMPQIGYGRKNPNERKRRK
ncbi:Nin one binding Zn-ribbon like-domain-containing protein [Phanerochaete sordida]|uniref:20S-pre-rRNA D-site endonuclease NOB1 n=1 Tax=Phanerochaete sordida TaxID=48140 RepID=A0A9P3FXF8_9APHY|nr:Nin one binding Zn-ribbon like-domain-containing protein [Phanerochaete sordida]